MIAVFFRRRANIVEADPYSIRFAERGDAKTIHAMITALAVATDDKHRVKSTPRDFAAHGFGADALFEALIAERGGGPVGLCVFFFSFSTWLGEPGIYIQDLYVRDEERGRGLGLRLLSAAAAHGLGRRASHLRLSVHSQNSAARSFYDRIGMDHRDEEETYHLGGDAFLALADGAE